MTRAPSIGSGDLVVKRVYHPRRPYDGLRILVDWIWPRGLTTASADLDEWCPALAPSAALRRWYRNTATRFSEFRERYLSELDEPANAEALTRLHVHSHDIGLTLLTATHDLFTSPALVLAQRLSFPSRHALAVEPTTSPIPDAHVGRADIASSFGGGHGAFGPRQQ